MNQSNQDDSSEVEERCDQIDNDCDGKVDEDFDLFTDHENCGGCGTLCTAVSLIGECEAGRCVYICGTPPQPTSLERCLELECTPRVEVCDGLDNDCDGQADEEAVSYTHLRAQRPY